MDRVHKPHNLSAILRSADAVGIMAVHAVSAGRRLSKLNHTSGGAQRWIALHHHPDAGTGLAQLRAAGHRLYAAHFSDAAVDFREADYTLPSAIVVGTEKYGVADETLALVDQQITIPMHGMTRSLNVSVATALILYEAERQRRAAGLYQPRALDLEPWQSLHQQWLEREEARKAWLAGSASHQG